MKNVNDDLYATLRATPLLSQLANDDFDKIIDKCPVRSHPAGYGILSPRVQADRFYIILSGKVRIYKLSQKGDEQILHIYGAGETFGEAAMWRNINFPAHAETIEDSEILSVSKAILRQMIQNNADLAMQMLSGMSTKLHEFNRLIEQLSLKGVPARLANLLLESPTRPGTNTIVLSETKRQIAARIGTAAETLSRAFAKLKADGLIEVKGREITILNAEGLESFLDQ